MSRIEVVVAGGGTDDVHRSMMTQVEQVEQALRRLEAALVDAGHPLLDHLQPGLTHDKIVETMGPTGLMLSDEAAAVWRWRNGVAPLQPDPDMVGGDRELPGGRTLLPLDVAVEDYLRNRDQFPWDQLDDLSPAWFPLVTYGHGYVWVDCSVGRDESAPLICRSHEGNADPIDQRSVPSVAAGIEAWAKLLERRIYRIQRPGELVTYEGQTYPLNLPRPMWMVVRDPDPDLPARWITA